MLYSRGFIICTIKLTYAQRDVKTYKGALSVSRLVLGTVNQTPRGNNGAKPYLGCLTSQNSYFPLHLYLIFCHEGIEECYRYKPLKFHEKLSYPLLALRKIDQQLAYQCQSIYGRKRLSFSNIQLISLQNQGRARPILNQKA